MIPALPVDAVRAAMEAEDWPLATQLLDTHADDVRAQLQRARDEGMETDALHDACRTLLAAQQALAADIVARRDAVAAAIDKLGQEHRGARAWLKELA